MRILVAHIPYRLRGGEDSVVETEVRLLRAAGHEVSTLIAPSIQFSALRRSQQIAIASQMGDHSFGRLLVGAEIARSHPELVHFHNLYPLLGTGAVQEANRLGCATVQTFHNYRLSCIAGTHFRAGAVCEDCSAGHLTLGILHGCYRASRLQSLAMAGGVKQQWNVLRDSQIPHIGICLTEFMRERLIRFGAPEEALFVKANTVEPSTHMVEWGTRTGAVYVGRLSPEKGIAELAAAWPLGAPTLTIIGAGPLLDEVRVNAGANVRVLGEVPSHEVRTHLADALVCILPSVCFEGLPTVVLEAFAEGTPVVGFAVGALREVLGDQGAPAIAELGDFDALCSMAMTISDLRNREWSAVSLRAQGEYEERYSEASGEAALTAVYRRALDHAQASRG